jgi:hypothetical protein
MKKLLTLLVSVLFLSGMSSIVKSNIGAKNIEYIEGKTENYSAASYIQDGLVAHWDGIENAGYGVHDGDATIWTELIGTFPLVANVGDCSWTENGLQNDSTTAYAVWVNRIKGVYDPAPWPLWEWYKSIGLIDDTTWQANVISDYTLECVITYESLSKETYLFTLSESTPHFDFSGYFVWSQLRLVFRPINNWLPGGNYDGCVCSPGIPISASGVARIDGGSILTANGNVVKTSATPNTYTLDVRFNSGLYVPPNGGKLHCMRIYNRALNGEEVMHNWKVDKARFGLR